MVLASAGVLATGCAQATQGARSGGEQEQAVVQVSNQNWNDMTIYVLQGNGSRHRLGSVTSFTKRTFKLPRYITASSEIRLLADPIGSAREHVSPPLVPDMRSILVWRLENSMQFSSFHSLERYQ